MVRKGHNGAADVPRVERPEITASSAGLPQYLGIISSKHGISSPASFRSLLLGSSRALGTRLDRRLIQMRSGVPRTWDHRCQQRQGEDFPVFTWNGHLCPVHCLLGALISICLICAHSSPSCPCPHLVPVPVGTKHREKVRRILQQYI